MLTQSSHTYILIASFTHYDLLCSQDHKTSRVAFGSSCYTFHCVQGTMKRTATCISNGKAIRTFSIKRQPRAHNWEYISSNRSSPDHERCERTHLFTQPASFGARAVIDRVFVSSIMMHRTSQSASQQINFLQLQQRHDGDADCSGKAIIASVIRHTNSTQHATTLSYYTD